MVANSIIITIIMVKSNTKPTKTSGSTQVITDFGTRKIVGQNFSKMISLPKTALANLGSTATNLKIELVQENGEKFLKLSPARGGKRN